LVAAVILGAFAAIASAAPIVVPQSGTNLPADLAPGDTLRLVTLERLTGYPWSAIAYRFDATVSRGGWVALKARDFTAGPVYLDRPGITYRLTEDVATPGTAFAIVAPNVTLDLGGHTVTWGMDGLPYRYGVALPPGYKHANPVWSQSDLTRFGAGHGVTVTNGRLIQGGRGPWCFSVGAYGISGVTLKGVNILTRGDDSWGVWISESQTVAVTGCAVTDSTSKVTNRHQGRAAIEVETLCGGTCTIANNTITNARQWGIRVGRRLVPGVAPPVGIIQGNTIDVNSIVTNGYGIGLHGHWLTARGNTITARNGRGIHIEGNDCRVISNVISVHELPDTTEYGRVSAHGIKLEDCAGAEVVQNTVISYQYSEPGRAGVGGALNVSDRGGCYVHDNTFEAVALKGPAWNPDDYGVYAAPLEIMCIGMGTRFERNTFKSNDRLIQFVGYQASNECICDTTADGYALPPANAFTGNYWVRRPENTGREEIGVQYSHFKGLVFRPAGLTNCTLGSWYLGWDWKPCGWSVVQPDGRTLQVVAQAH
jgi:hypothetical protein